MLFSPSSRKFKSDIEVRTAFLCGELPWRRSDAAVLLEVRADAEGRPVIQGHRFVRILDACALGTTHEPVYACETEGRDLVQVDQRFLTSWRALMFNEKGEPSDYARWEAARLEARRQRELAGHRTDVIMLAEFAL